MSKQDILRLIKTAASEEGLTETNIKGVQLFNVTKSIPCVPAVYDPCIVAIVSGAKEAVLDGQRYIYDANQYMCCPLSLPVEAGSPSASPDTPLLGVMISLDTRVMTELNLEMDRIARVVRPLKATQNQQGLTLARWDDAFTDALLRLLQLMKSEADTAILGDARLREFYYAVLNGDAGHAARRAFGVGNDIARAIGVLSSRLHEPVTIEDLADKAHMSRAVFHRKFKQATTMSPIQFVKAMRLNRAAMQIAGGARVSEAAMDVGYASSSQFSREFKRTYGQSPKQWSETAQLPMGA